MRSRRRWRTSALAVCASAALAWGAGGRSVAAAQVAPDPVRSILQELTDLIGQAQTRNLGDFSTSERDLRWLGNAAAPAVNPLMLAGLRADADALRAALGGTADPARLIPFVVADLSLKAEYCKAHKEGMNAVVKLTVQTWAGAAIAPRWQVAYISAPLAILRGAHGEPFPQFSSPTSMSLPPGRYVVWAQDPANGSKRGPAKEVALGEHGLEAVQLDVLVPAS